MSWRDAPLYVEAYDLAGWVLGRAHTWTERGERNLAPLVARAACSLVEKVALALTFPEKRADHLEGVDQAIVVLRTRLRLAENLGLLSRRGLRFASDRLRVIGRIVGGWRKRVSRPESSQLGNRGRAPAAGA